MPAARCAGCSARLDKRGRSASGYCRQCFNALPVARRLPFDVIVGAVNAAPTELLRRALESRGITLTEARE